MNDKSLIIAESLNPVEVFFEGGIEKIIEIVRQKCREFVPNVTTDEGRKDIASMAYKVSRSKTLLDTMRKELLLDAKKKIDRANNCWAPIRDELDKLRDEVRQPLTDFENAEKKKKEAEEQRERERIQSMVSALGKFGKVISFLDATALTVDEFTAMLDSAKADYQAELERQDALKKEREQEAKRLADERAEFERLKKEQAERERIEREKIESERRAIAEAQAIERKKIEDERREIEAEKIRLAEIENQKKKQAEDDKRKADAIKFEEVFAPDRKKLMEWADEILGITCPELNTDEARKIASNAISEIYAAARYIHYNVKN